MLAETLVISPCCSGVALCSSACAGSSTQHVPFSSRRSARRLDRESTKVGPGAALRFALGVELLEGASCGTGKSIWNPSNTPAAQAVPLEGVLSPRGWVQLQPPHPARCLAFDFRAICKNPLSPLWRSSQNPETPRTVLLGSHVESPGSAEAREGNVSFPRTACSSHPLTSVRLRRAAETPRRGREGGRKQVLVCGSTRANCGSEIGSADASSFVTCSASLVGERRLGSISEQPPTPMRSDTGKVVFQFGREGDGLEAGKGSKSCRVRQIVCELRALRCGTL